MKKSIFFITCVSLSLAAFSLKAQSGWQQVSTGLFEAFETVYITPAGTVYIGTEQGNIYRSYDGGTTLTATTTGVTDGIADIVFTSPSAGMAVGDDGMILSTSDSGSTWSSVFSGVSANLESVFFVDADTAYIAGRDGVILKSTNAGASWNLLNSGSNERLESVFFSTASRGFVAGREGEFLKTTDFGATWTSINLGSDDNNSVFFTHPDTGFVAGENGIFKTVNAGDTWAAVTVVGGMEPNAVHFGASRFGYAVGEMGEISRSIDAGDNWAPDTTLGIAELNDVFFVDSQNGLAVGDGGTLLRRTGPGSGSFCHASFWIDTASSGGSNLYLVNNSFPASSNPLYIISYSWDFGDGGTSAQKLPTHTYAQFGAYEVCLSLTVTDAHNNTCTDTYCDSLGLDSVGNILYKASLAGFTLNVIDSASIGMREHSLRRMKIYPNPVQEGVQISYPEEWRETRLQVISLTGEVVKQLPVRSGDEVQMSDLPAGTYLLRLSKNGRLLTSKILLKR